MLEPRKAVCLGGPADGLLALVEPGNRWVVFWGIPGNPTHRYRLEHERDENGKSVRWVLIYEPESPSLLSETTLPS